jgi:hypothetical protein
MSESVDLVWKAVDEVSPVLDKIGVKAGQLANAVPIDALMGGGAVVFETSAAAIGEMIAGAERLTPVLNAVQQAQENVNESIMLARLTLNDATSRAAQLQKQFAAGKATAAQYAEAVRKADDAQKALNATTAAGVKTMKGAKLQAMGLAAVIGWEVGIALGKLIDQTEYWNERMQAVRDSTQELADKINERVKGELAYQAEIINLQEDGEDKENNRAALLEKIEGDRLKALEKFRKAEAVIAHERNQFMARTFGMYSQEQEQRMALAEIDRKAAQEQLEAFAKTRDQLLEQNLTKEQQLQIAREEAALRKQVNSNIENLQEKLDKINMTEAEKLEYDLKQLGAGAQKIEQALKLQKEIEKAEAAKKRELKIEEMQKRAAQERREARKAEQEEAKQLTESSMTKQEKFMQQVIKLNDMKRRGLIDETTLQRQLANARNQVGTGSAGQTISGSDDRFLTGAGIQAQDKQLEIAKKQLSEAEKQATAVVQVKESIDQVQQTITGLIDQFTVL